MLHANTHENERHGIRSTRACMRRLDPARWDDVVLAVLLLVIGVPRVVLAVFYDRSVGVEGVLSMIGVALALLILLYRNITPRTPARR
ncbi:MAG TPA: hypothetical protein VFQ53_31360 [Kofleriaceae bacterium]|nr:hypothetical protein [Kofleriaceae bacterium]